MERSTVAPVHTVELIVRNNCGSCERVREQITPVLEEAGVELIISNVDEDPALKIEFGDRVPVILIDDEEFACWEIDNDDLAKALL
ncbi:glutaredoxin family protein [Corynebacterium pacaense]|uniref:glutaredoxin family protein n=1 Tax=Corynebacterium pacaense TaxID=1816684 RepID=UPI0009BA1E80|nr:glutaredoxin family protein [Corynebacterium pacaense]